MRVPLTTRETLVVALTILLCLALSALAAATFAADENDRARIAAFFTEYKHTLRSPLVAETASYAPRADWLGGIVADAALNDVYGEVNLNDLEPEQREAWLAILPRIDEELESSRAILLDSFRARPGWAMHPASVGKIEYTIQRRTGRMLELEKWRIPLTFAAASAPGSLTIPVFQAAGEMELASVGGVKLAQPQRRIIQRAFAETTFLQNALPTAFALLGSEDAIAVVPDEPRPLRCAFDYLAQQGDIPRAATTWSRWENAEKEFREKELREIERVAKLGDRRRLIRLIHEWTASHSPRDFGDTGAAQLVRLLRVWPADDSGSWRRDPRGGIVRVLLERDPKPGSEAGNAIWRATRPLDGVPESRRAEAMLAGGRLDDAERLALASETAGSFEWTGFWVAASRERLRRREPARARSALANIAPAARGECDVTLASGEVAAYGVRRAADRVGAPAQASSRASTRDLNGRSVHDQGSGEGSSARLLTFSPGGSLPLCLDGSRESLILHFEMRDATLLSIGWSGSHDTAVLVKAGDSIAINLKNRSGREILTIQRLAGANMLSATAN